MSGSASAFSTDGGSGGRKVLHNYHDHGHIAYNSEAEKNLRIETRNNNPPDKMLSFPEKLHMMLSQEEGSGLAGSAGIISW
jgi:hypothetical protein